MYNESPIKWNQFIKHEGDVASMTDFAEEIFGLLGNPNDSLRLSELVESFDLKEDESDPPEIIVKLKKNMPALDVKWVRDTLSEYDVFYKFTIVS
jgi:hypothetical protein